MCEDKIDVEIKEAKEIFKERVSEIQESISSGEIDLLFKQASIRKKDKECPKIIGHSNNLYCGYSSYDEYEFMSLNFPEYVLANKKKEYEKNFYNDVVDEIDAFLSDYYKIFKYLSVEAMSDVEVNYYKQKQIEKLILEFKKNCKITKQQIDKIKKDNDLSNDKIKKLKIAKKKSELRVEKYKIKGIISQIKDTPIQEVKNTIYRGNSFSWWFDKKKIYSIIEDVLSKQYSKNDSILTSIEFDYEKIGAFSKLLKTYINLLKKSNKIISVVHVDQVLQNAGIKPCLVYYKKPLKVDQVLQNAGIKLSDDFFDNDYNIKDFDPLFLQISECEERIKKIRKILKTEFTDDKLSKLVFDKNEVDDVEIDMDFLKIHSDKVDKEDFKNLKLNIDKTNKLLNRIFKTKANNERIENLKSLAKQDYIYIINKIIHWYETEFYKLFKSRNELTLDSFKNFETLKHSLNRAELQIGIIQAKLEDFKNDVYIKKFEMGLQKELNEKEIEKISKKIVEAIGEQFYELDINKLIDSDICRMTDKIQNAHILKYKLELLNLIFIKVQKQADIKEAELRGITVEELSILKNQNSQNVNEEQSQTLNKIKNKLSV